MTPPQRDLKQIIADLEFQLRGLQSSYRTLETELSDLKRRVDIATEPRDLRYMPTGIPRIGIQRPSAGLGLR